jgi:hypothetical protein
MIYVRGKKEKERLELGSEWAAEIVKCERTAEAVCQFLIIGALLAFAGRMFPVLRSMQPLETQVICNAEVASGSQGVMPLSQLVGWAA